MRKYWWFVLAFIYLIPILVYIYVFGVGVWHTHDDWSKMGSALGGIYSPIIAFTTLLLLYRQQNFNEKSHAKKSEYDFIQKANSKCESYVTLAGVQYAKLDRASVTNLIELLEHYGTVDDAEQRFSILHALNDKFRPQITSLTRAGSTIHHMRNSDVDLTGQVSDLRVYAASLIDIDLLLAHDSFSRCFLEDESYYSFEPSPNEIDRVNEKFNDTKKSKTPNK